MCVVWKFIGERIVVHMEDYDSSQQLKDHQDIMREYVETRLSVKRIEEGVILPPEIVHFLTSELQKDERIATSMALFDRPMVMRHRRSKDSTYDIQTIHPNISALVDAVPGEDDPIKALMVIQTIVNEHIEKTYNATQKRQQKRLQFLFVNQSFMSEVQESNDIMGVFVQRGGYEQYFMIQDSVGLTQESSLLWLNRRNNREDVIHLIEQEKYRRSGSIGSDLLEFISLVLIAIV